MQNFQNIGGPKTRRTKLLKTPLPLLTHIIFSLHMSKQFKVNSNKGREKTEKDMVYITSKNIINLCIVLR